MEHAYHPKSPDVFELCTPLPLQLNEAIFTNLTTPYYNSFVIELPGLRNQKMIALFSGPQNVPPVCGGPIIAHSSNHRLRCEQD
jgi:hypothetical protein